MLYHQPAFDAAPDMPSLRLCFASLAGPRLAFKLGSDGALTTF